MPTDKELIQMIRKDAREIQNTPSMVFALRELKVKPIKLETTKTVAIIQAIDKNGIPFTTPLMFAQVENIDVQTALSRLHILGDKGVLDLIYKPKNVKEQGLLRYRLSSRYVQTIKSLASGNYQK